MGKLERQRGQSLVVRNKKKYFQIYNYSNKLKAKMTIYNVTKKEYIWWKDIKKVKGIKERYVAWKTFKNNFKIKYFSKQYYKEIL